MLVYAALILGNCSNGEVGEPVVLHDYIQCCRREWSGSLVVFTMKCIFSSLNLKMSSITLNDVQHYIYNNISERIGILIIQ